MAALDLLAKVDTDSFRELAESIVESMGYFGAEFIVAATALGILLADLFIPRSLSRHLAWAAVLGCVLGTLALPKADPTPSRLFAGMVALDGFASFYKQFFLVGAIPVVVLSFLSLELRGRRMGEYYGILLASLLGAMLLASSTHFLMLFLSLELLSISSYILVGYLRSDRRSAEAALKYVIYGSVAAGIMAYGFSLYYGLTGTADIASLAAVTWNPDAAAIGTLTVTRQVALAVIAALLLIFMGIAYKMSTIPMHFWAPDVYEGAPTPVTAFLSVISKAAGFALGLRFLKTLADASLGVAPSAPEESVWETVPWTEVLILISISTMTLGNLSALWQTNLKRLLAYSSIAHAGYMMMGLTFLTGPEVGGVDAITFYLLAYLAMNFGAFAVVLLIQNRVGSVELDEYRGLGRRAPFLALSLTVFLLSLIGIPPTAGFAGKWQLFMGVLDMGGREGAPAASGWYTALAIAAALNTAVSAYYYLKIVREAYLRDDARTERLDVPALGHAMVGAMVVVTFYLFLQANRVLEITRSLDVSLK